MEFFVENWIWFLTAGIILLMTLIGYIAEKTDFGRKDIPKKEDLEEEPVIEREEVENKPDVQISLATDSILENTEDDFILKSEPIEEGYTEESVPEELKVPFGDVSFEEPVESLTGVFENAAQTEEVLEVVNEEPVEELKLDEVSTPDIELPDLDSIVSEANSDDEDDDVWKF